MIFYFSGTGNSKHIADRIAEITGERQVFMSQSAIESKETYKISENERIGFVFPVYWYCLPAIAEKFLVQLKLSGYQKQYVYAIASYGIAAGDVMERFRKILTKKQIQLNGIFGVRMVDNYVVGYNIMNADKQRMILMEAETEIEKIKRMIERRQAAQYIKKGKIAFVTPVTGYAYRKTDHTKKFFAAKSCNGCRQCEKNCPCNTIHMENGMPVWEGECTFCLRCINSCRQAAIQYGKHTEKRDRYQYHGY